MTYNDKIIDEESIINNKNYILVDLENVEIFLKNQFLKYIRDVTIFDDSKVKIISNYYDNRCYKFFIVDKFVLSNKI